MSENVKIIACDVDGTLLAKGEKRINPKIFCAINKALEQGKIFVVASGRSKNALKKLFGENNEIIFVCSDGGLVVKGERVVYHKPISNEILSRLLPMLGRIDFVLYSKDKVYASNHELKTIVSQEGEEGELFLENFENEHIYKIAIFKKGKSESYPLHYIEANGLLRKCYSDESWTEYVSVGANKGDALEYIQKEYDIKYEETAAFGDNYNDIDMLKKAYYSYAVKNAKIDVKLLARYETTDVELELTKRFLK